MSKTCVLSEASGPKPRPPKAARWFGVLGAGLLTLLFQGYAHAQAARTLTQEQQVVEALLQRHPQLRVALLTQAQSNAVVRAEQARYSAVFDAFAGVSRTQSPSLSAGGVEVDTSRSVDLELGLNKTLPTGTNLAAHLSGQRFSRSFAPGSLTPLQTAQGGYHLAAQVSLNQPLLRGAGSELGLASLRLARLDAAYADLAVQRSAHELVANALLVYWELWYADQALRINRAARDLAALKEEQARARVSAGALANVEQLTFEAQLAELDEAVVLASTERQQRALDLALALGAAPETWSFEPSGEPETALRVPAAEHALKQATAASHTLKQLELEVQSAQQRIISVVDPTQPRLDLAASLRAEGLSSPTWPPAVEQVGSLGALSGQVGLTFQTPVDNTTQRAQLSVAHLAVHIAKQQLQAEQVRLRNEVRSVLAAHAAAERRVELAQTTVNIARQLAAAERDRFALGASIPLQVQQAEETLRQAELRVQRARVELAAANIRLELARGTLLSRFAPQLARLPAAQRRTLGSQP